jgi:hypothetical protein
MSAEVKTVKLKTPEQQMLLAVLTDMRNRLLELGKDTETIDDVFLKVAKARGRPERWRDGER